MSKNTNNIEDVFKRNFDNYKVEPSNNLWSKIETQIDNNQAPASSPFRKKLFFISLSLIFVSSTILWTSLTDVEKKSNENTVAFEFVVADSASVGKVPKVGTETILYSGTTSIKKAAIVESLVDNTLQRECRETDTGNVNFVAELMSQNHDTESVSSIFSYNTKTENIKKPTAKFSPEVDDGCVPVDVRFRNQSVNAERYSWDFGDGNYSDEENPAHVFYQSGTYKVSLTIYRGDEISVFVDTIQVNETPNPVVGLLAETNTSVGQSVKFYNKTNDNDYYYEWNFGDNHYSHAREPIHQYTKIGKYSVEVKIWTKSECFKSTKFTVNVSNENGCELIFPNAFTPNLSGPSGGYYDLRNMTNDVFCPLHKGVADYHLQVFSRSGLLVFETKDINIGWDGYIGKRLASQGVYVWRVGGRWENGNPIKRVGNLTLVIARQ